jgi:hypothetical protein
VEAGEVVWVAGVEETEGAEETGEAEVLVGAVGEVEAVVASGTGEAIEVGDAVEAEEVGGAVVALVVIGAAVAERKSNIATASAAEIFEVIQSLSLP